MTTTAVEERNPSLKRTVKGGLGKNLIEYRGYVGRVVFDDEAGIFHGEVINLKDVITFQGECVAELREALKDSVEDYLDFCKERGEKPEKPLSGKFVVRLDPELHQEISKLAAMEGISLNQWVSRVLEEST